MVVLHWFCENENDKCDECINGFVLYDNKCLTECPNGTFLESNGKNVV